MLKKKNLNIRNIKFIQQFVKKTEVSIFSSTLASKSNYSLKLKRMNEIKDLTGNNTSKAEAWNVAR